ncbi:MAG: DUF1109 family protein [Salinarimonadaceae bacterium]|nr:MAG: DUF1109 family protein [Salinarimonadaceae bacterium]
MKTDDLIRTLAADAAAAPPVESYLRPALVAGFAASLALFLVTLGLRPDLAQAAETLRFVVKPFFPLIFAICALIVLARLWRPGARVPGALLVLAPALLALAVGLELAAEPSERWGALLVGDNALKCLVFIPLFSAAPLAAILYALRHGAPTRPALTGAVAGLVAAGIGATLYALHCPDDSPLFVAAWYALATALVCGVGALLGARFLRW